MTNILIIDEDTKNTAELIDYLKSEKYNITVSHNSLEGIALFKHKGTFDLVLLDISLPGADGWQVCGELSRISNVPLIIITHKSEIFDILLGLELGADDYVTKPFNNRELLGRIKAVLRRCKKERTELNNQQEIALTNLTINLSKYELIIGGEKIKVPPKELELLFYLMSHPNKVLSRDNLLDDIWGFEYYGDSRTVDVHIKRIREKLNKADAQGKWELKTIWGVGYKFEINTPRG